MNRCLLLAVFGLLVIACDAPVDTSPDGSVTPRADATTDAALPPTRCGDGACDGGETPGTCPADCEDGAPICGDGVCEVGETPDDCAADCDDGGPVCGDGTCDEGEACAADCDPCGGAPCPSGGPVLRFSDLISGPDTGLGDGLGSGVVVTVWGQGLGETEGRVVFTDAAGATHDAAHVYYWKRADGALPSGPADLWSSHRMQEIAFSIPDAADGPGTIHVEVDGAPSNSLPFTVRAGRIFHVSASGSDGADGSGGAPWASAEHALDEAPAGSTIYLHDVAVGSDSSFRGLYWNNGSASSTREAQFAVVSFPGTRPTVTAQQGAESYNTEAMVIAKLDMYASNYTAVDANDQPTGSTIASGGTWAIKTSRHGRAVANRIGDIPGGCASRTQGAIVGSARFGDDVSDYRILGNEVYDYGCAGSSKLHHTTYLSIRSDGLDVRVEPWEFGFNYLHGNEAKFGIHQFDQNEGCGDTTGPILIHDNVIVDQAGAGISVGSQCDWSMDVIIENNVLIDVGQAAAWDGRDPDTTDGPENGGIAIRDSGLTGTMYVRHNLIYAFTADGQTIGGQGCLNLNGSGDEVSIVWEDNICFTELDRPFVGAGFRGENKLDNVSGARNVWHFAGASPSEALVPSWDAEAITEDPGLTVTGAWVSLPASSPAVGRGAPLSSPYDIYGVARDDAPDVGPCEAE